MTRCMRVQWQVRCRVPLRVLFLVVAVAGGCAAPAETTRGDALTRLPVTAEDLTRADETWFGIYHEGRGKVGWARSRTYRSGSTLYPALVVENASRVRLLDGRESIMTEKLEFAVRPPHRLIRLTYADGDPMEGGVVKLEQRGDRALVARGEGPEAQVQERYALDYTLGDVNTFRHWLEAGREPGDILRFQEINSATLRVGEARYVVRGRAPLRVDGVEVIAYELEFQGLEEGVVSWLRADSGGEVHHLSLGLIEWRRESAEQAAHADTTLDLRIAIPVEPPLGARLDGDRVTLVMENPGALVIPVHPAQKLRSHPQTGEPLLVLERAPPGPVPKAVLLSPYEPDPRLSVFLEQVRSDDPEQQVRALVKLVARTLEDRFVPGTLTLEAILERREGDCTEHARLFRVLANALAIRCREVIGLVYTGDEHATFARHTWCEVAVGDQWWAVDPTTGAAPIGLGYIYLGTREGSMALTIPEDLRFRVLED